MTSQSPDPVPVWESADLATCLTRFGVETSAWGTADAKTIAHLVDEVRNGDCELVLGATGLTRRVANVWVDVYATIGGERHHLLERRQVFRDDRVRIRSLPASLGEKCKVGEEPLVAARRALMEELGIGSPLTLAPASAGESPTGPSSYPTLRTTYTTSWFIAELALADYRPAGYVELQSDKRTYFEWQPWIS